jgi:hypothetical protein
MRENDSLKKGRTDKHDEIYFKSWTKEQDNKMIISELEKLIK